MQERKIFVLPSDGQHRHLHSFPTRRSSDLATVRSVRERPVSLAIVAIVAAVIGGISVLVVGKAAGWLTNGTKKDRKSTRLNSSHQIISYAVFCLKKKKTTDYLQITS